MVDVATLTGNLFSIGEEIRRELRSLLCAKSSAVERILSFLRDGSLRFEGVGDSGSEFLRSRFSVPFVSVIKGELFAWSKSPASASCCELIVLCWLGVGFDEFRAASVLDKRGEAMVFWSTFPGNLSVSKRMDVPN